MIRLDRYLAEAGHGSRRDVAGLVRRGRVAVDGLIARDAAAKIDPARVLVTVDGVACAWALHHHRILHKPGGTVTSTVSDDGPSVLGCLPDVERDRGWMPVGRLDLDTTGLLLLTTDGELAHRLTHPRWKVAKRYRARLEGPVTPADAAAFSDGLTVHGERWLPAELAWGDDPTDVRVTLREGRYHQVKRMFASRGNAVVALHREAFGPLLLPAALRSGESRPLTADEVSAVYAAVHLDT